MKKKETPVTPSIKNNLPNESFVQKHFYRLLVVAFSFVLYANTIPNSYNLDDELVTINHRLTSKGIEAIPEIFSSPYYADNMGYKYEYRPIVLVSFAIEHQLFGDNPQVSHFFNALLYALLCLLLFEVLRRLLKKYSTWLVLLVVLLFAAHPIHTEVVASIKNRDELLALLACLGALYAAHEFVWKGKWVQLILVAVCFVLGLLSKLSVLSFALIIPMLLVLFVELDWKRLLALSVVLAVVATVFAKGLLIYQSTLLLLFVSTLPLLLYGSIHFQKEKLSQWYTKLHASIASLFIQTKSASSPLNLLDGFYDYRFSWSGIVSVVLLSVISFAGLKLGNRWLFLVPYGLLAAVIVFIKSWRYYAMLAFVSVSFGLSVYFPDVQKGEYGDLIMCLLALHIFLSERKFAIPFALLAIGLVIADYYVFNDYGRIQMLAVLVFMRFRILLPFVVFIIALNTQGTLNRLYLSYIHHQPFSPEIFFVSGLIVLCFLVFKRRQLRPVANYFVLLLIIYSVAAFYQYYVVNQTEQLVIRPITEVANIVSPKLIQVEVFRPLTEIELPVRATSPLPIRLGTSMDILGKYLKLVVVPYPMSFYYGYKYIEPKTIADALPIAILLFHLFLFSLSIYYCKKEPLLSAGIWLYLISISVFSNLLMPIPGMLGDRYLFVPSLGFTIVVSWVLFKVYRMDLFAGKEAASFQYLPKPFSYTVLGILLVYSGLTVARNADWKDALTLFTTDIKHLDNSAQAHNLLALHQVIRSNELDSDPALQREMREEALVHFKRSLAIYPKFMNVQFDIGRVNLMLGKNEEAKQAFLNTIKIDSTFSESHFNLGILLDKEGKLEEAIPYYQFVIRNNPQRLEAYNNLSFLLFRANHLDDALDVCREAQRNIPNAFDPLVNMAKVFMKKEMKDSAMVYFEKGYALKPNDGALTNVLYKLSQERGDKEKMDFYAKRLGIH